MRQRKSFMYIASFLALAIPTTGRFVFGLTLMLELIILQIMGILLNSLVTKLKLNEIRTYFVMFFMIAITILYRQILVLTYTEIALTLGFLIYLPPVSVYLTHTLFGDYEDPISERLKGNLLNTVTFALMILFFFLFRDIAGYGTFTFFASIPGALVLTGLVIYFFLLLRNKIRIISSRGEKK